jgi:hypothetical protein
MYGIHACRNMYVCMYMHVYKHTNKRVLYGHEYDMRIFILSLYTENCMNVCVMGIWEYCMLVRRLKQWPSVHASCTCAYGLSACAHIYMHRHENYTHLPSEPACALRYSPHSSSAETCHLPASSSDCPSDNAGLFYHNICAFAHLISCIWVVCIYICVCVCVCACLGAHVIFDMRIHVVAFQLPQKVRVALFLVKNDPALYMCVRLLFEVLCGGISLDFVLAPVTLWLGADTKRIRVYRLPHTLCAKNMKEKHTFSKRAAPNTKGSGVSAVDSSDL